MPLSQGHPLALPGCTVLVADHILYDFAVAGSTVESRVAIPADPSLPGTEFFHQVVPVELGASGAIQALSASNGLRLIVGLF